MTNTNVFNTFFVNLSYRLGTVIFLKANVIFYEPQKL